ncbi:MAG: LamG domain-containing protein [Myxococcota bacterium]
MGVVGLAMGIALASACDSDTRFMCTSHEQCTKQSGEIGACETDGYCSFSDPNCDSGQRYAAHSGPMSGECTLMEGNADPDEASYEPPPETGDSDALDGSTGEDPEGADSATSATSTTSEPTTGMVDDETGTTTGPLSDPDLVLWLDFEVLHPGGTEDASDFMSDGSCGDPTCPEATTGVTGQGVRFDGDDNLWVQHDSHLETHDGLTVSAWVWLEDPLTSRGVIAAKPFGSGIANSWELFFNLNSGEPRLVWGMNLGGEHHKVNAYGDFPVQQWFHVVGTWDGSISSLWIDGILIDATPVPTIDLDTHPVIIGADDDHDADGSLNGFYEDRLDELRVYRRALDEDEILDLMNQDAP